MNFHYIFTILWAIFILFLILIDTIEAYLVDNHNSKSLKAVRKMERQDQIQRRQTLDDNFFQNLANDNLAVNLKVPNCDKDFSELENNRGIWMPDQVNYPSQPLEEFKDLLGALNKESKKMPRKIGLFESKTNKGEAKKEKNENNINKENQAKIETGGENDANEVGGDKQFKFKYLSKTGGMNNKSHKKIYKHGRQNLGQLKGFLQEDNEINCNQISGCSDSDISCCQHCSEHQQNTDLDSSGSKPKYSSRVNAFHSNKDKSLEENYNFNSKYFEKPVKNFKKTNKLQASYKSIEQKYPEEGVQAAEEDEDEDEDDMFKLKFSAGALSDKKQEFENLNYSFPSLDNKYLKSQHSQIQSLNDQLENTKNNLSHEANYKLSKNEQDASEKKKDFSWNWGIFKRSYKFNPMNEIKLKTSSRLMKKGFGASLPSYSLGETRQELMISKTLRKKEQEILKEKQRKYENEQNMEPFNEPLEEDLDLDEVPLEYDLSVKPQKDWSYNIRKKRISELRKRFKREELKQMKKQKEIIQRKQKTKQKIVGEKNTDRNSLHSKDSINASKSDSMMALKVDRDYFQVLANTLEKPNKDFKKLAVTNVIEAQNDKKSLNHVNENDLQTCKLQSFSAANKLNLQPFKYSNNFVPIYKPLRRRRRSLQIEKSTKASTINDTLQLLFNKAGKTKSSLNYTKALAKRKPFYLHNLKSESLMKALKRRNALSTKKAKKFSLNTTKILKKTSNTLKAFRTHMLANDKLKALNILQRAKRFKPLEDLRNNKLYLNTTENCKKSINTTKVSSKQKMLSNHNLKSLKTLKRIKRFNPSTALQLKIYQKFHSPEALRFYQHKKLSTKDHKKHHKRLRTKRSLECNFKPLRNSAEKNNLFRAFTKNLLKKAQTLKKHFKTLVRKSWEYLSYKKGYTKNLAYESFDSKDLNVSNLYKMDKLLLNVENSVINKTFANESFKDNKRIRTKKISRNAKWRLFKEFLNLLNFNKSLGSFNEKELTEFYKLRPQRSKNIDITSAGEELQNKNNFIKKPSKASTKESFLNNLFTESNFPAKNQELFNHSSKNKTLGLDKLNIKEIDSSSRPKNVAKTLKRFKRSMNLNFNENILTPDKTIDFNKRTYFPEFDDLYRKPEYKLEFPDIKRNKFMNSQLNYDKDILQDLLTKPKTNSEYNFEDNDKSFNIKDLYKLKEKNSYKNINEDIKFNSPWYKEQKHPEAIKYHKRLTKSKKFGNSKNKLYSKKYFKRHNLNNFRNNLTDINNNQKEFALSDFPLKVQKLKDQYLNDLQNFNENYKFNENHFNWPNIKTYMNNNTKNSQNLSLELRNEILNCKAFSSLEDFLKSLPKNITDTLLKDITDTTTESLTTDNIEMNINTLDILDKTTVAGPTVLDSTIICSSTSEAPDTTEEPAICTETIEDYSQPTVEEEFEIESKETSSENIADFITTSTLETTVSETTTEEIILPTSTDGCDVKLNITINANVQGNSKSNHYCGNGSFNIMSGLEEDERKRRGIFMSPLENLQKKKCAEIPTQKPYDAEDNEELTDLISGKYSSNIVNSILNTVRETPHLKELWPSLQHNQPKKRADIPNFYAIKNQQNDQQLQDSEKLLAKVMSSINTIIEEQARSHACVPLRPDLQEFYNMILQSRREQDMIPIELRTKRK